MTTVLQESPVLREMVRCLDTRLEVLAFAKDHRPEERAKLAAATARLHALQAAYPVHWRMLQRRLRQARADLAQYVELT